MSSGISPAQIFSMISGVGDTFAQARGDRRKQDREDQTREVLAGLGGDVANGTIDYSKAAAKLLALGELGGGVSLLKLGAEDRASKLQEAAGLGFSNFLQGSGGAANRPTFTPASGTPRANIDGTVHVAETEDDVQRLERATGQLLSPQDKDAITRTVYGEASGEGPVGQAAVAGVIANRARQSGMTPVDVVTARNQFEPHNTPEGRARMASLDPNSAEYRRIVAASIPVVEGNAPDPTGGADHFYSPSAQAELAKKDGRPAVARFDDGAGVDIGRHRFFKQGYRPEGPVQVAQADIPAPGAQETQFVIPGQPVDAVRQMPLPQRIPQLMGWVANPHLPQGAKEVAKTLLSEALQESRLTNEQKEYAMARAEGFTGSFMDYQLALKKAGATNLTNKLDMTGPTEEAKAIGKAAGERAAATMQAAGAATKTLARLGDMEARLNAVKTGRLEPGRMTMAALGKSLGVSEDVLRGIGLNPEAVGDAQAVNAITSRMVVDMIGSGGFPANNFSNADRDFLLQIVPSLANDPRANSLIIEAARRTANIDIQKAREWRRWKAENKDGSFDDFELQWAEKMAGQNIMDDLRKKAEELTGASSGSGAPGQPDPQGWVSAPGGIRIREKVN